MQPEQLFGMALGIVSPWEVKEITFSKESNRLDIYIDFQKGAQFPCPVCGALCVPGTGLVEVHVKDHHLNAADVTVITTESVRTKRHGYAI